MDEECTIGPLKKAALGSGPLRTCDGLSSTILSGLVRNVAHALSEGAKRTHGPKSRNMVRPGRPLQILARAGG